MGQDARGIIAPDAGLTQFRMDRFAPSTEINRLVDRYWLIRWDLDEPFTQRVYPHPVVNVVFQPGAGTVNGVATRVDSRELAGEGWALGVMFRPAGFRPLTDGPLTALRDREVALDRVFGSEGTGLSDAVNAASTAEDRIAEIETFLAARLPAGRHPAEDTAALVERIAANPSSARVESLAREERVSTRQLQRRFADHVGLSPKNVVRRYRLYEAAERVRHGTAVDWADLAATLGYSDQPHLSRDFTAVIGVSPGRYTQLCGAPAA
ncbi:AraC family transcriptional regulator [Spiractinospora alimapuensis]|nr:AraC family transcriptional regulator [Spiractinospora alimapuensis]